MTDLRNGVIEVNGFTITPETTLDEMLDFFGEKVRVLDLSLGPKVKFLSRYYLTDNIYAYSFQFGKDGKIDSFSLTPEPPSTVVDRGYGEIPKYMLSASQKWLGDNIGATPNSINDYCVYYKFDNVDYYASITRDRDYGLVGGAIIVTFHRG